MIPRDTTPAAAALQEEVCRRAGPARRFEMALELSDLTHAFAIAGLRQRHPDLGVDDAQRALAAMLYTDRPSSAA